MEKSLQLLNSIKHGGAENVAYNYAKILRDHNVDSTFVALPNSGEYAKMLAANNFQIECRLTGKLLLTVDYIFIHSNQNLLKLLPYLFLLKKRNKRVFYVQHLSYSTRKFKLLSLLINLLCTDFIQITPVTKELVDRYIKIDSHLIVNFYISRYLKKDWDKIRYEVRKELNIPQKNSVLMFSGVFKPGKNVGEFVSLASSFKEDTTKTFLLIGDGVESTIVKSYSGTNLKWIGFVNDVEKYLIAADVYLFLSKFEMTPMALLEAINTEKYIIAYDTPINDFLLSGKTFQIINKKVIIDNEIVLGSSLLKYDKQYAVDIFGKLLRR